MCSQGHNPEANIRRGHSNGETANATATPAHTAAALDTHTRATAASTGENSAPTARPGVISDAIGELSALIGSAIAASTLDRDALLDTAKQIANGGDYARARLGHLVAHAVIVALQTTPRPAPSPLEAAQEAFKPQDAQG